MAESPDLVTLFIAPLNALDIAYMVTGAVAAVVYGEPRFTRDLDLVVTLNPAQARRLVATFPLADFYVPPEDVLIEEAGRPRGGHFNIIHHDTGLKADCDVAGEDALQDWGMARRRRFDIHGVPVWMAPIEYVIARKLEWYRESGSTRHVEDIRAMLRVSGDAIDRAALDEWIDRLRLQDAWHAVRPGP